MWASQAVWSRDSHVVAAFTHLRRYQTWINWYYKIAVPGLSSPVENQWSRSKSTNPVTICHCRQAPAAHSTRL